MAIVIESFENKSGEFHVIMDRDSLSRVSLIDIGVFSVLVKYELSGPVFQ